jgi:hypothetical protein
MVDRAQSYAARRRQLAGGAVPSATIPGASLPVHQIAFLVHGVHLLENMNLAEVVASGRNEFCFEKQSLRAQGFSGSTVSPAALF